MELVGTAIRGIYRDLLIGPDGRVIADRGWSSNTIVMSCRVLLAGFLKNEPSDGIRYLAVGQGQAAWDAAGAPAPDPALTVGLEQPYAPPIPAAELGLAYLNESDSEIALPSSRLQITATLKPGYPAPLAPLTTYPLREFGLFARFGGSDTMINCIRHPVILKDAATTLIRIVRLYF